MLLAELISQRGNKEQQQEAIASLAVAKEISEEEWAAIKAFSVEKVLESAAHYFFSPQTFLSALYQMVLWNKSKWFLEMCHLACQIALFPVIDKTF